MDKYLGRVFSIIGNIELLISLIIKCPAIRLAIKRNLKVKGRIISLIISIITKNAIKGKGVDLGTKCTREFL